MVTQDSIDKTLTSVGVFCVHRFLTNLRGNTVANGDWINLVSPVMIMYICKTNSNRMTTLFFLLIVPFLLFEINTLFNTKKSYSFRKSVATKEAFDNGDSGDKAIGCLYLSFAMFYFIWSILGVALSSQ